LGGWWKGPGSWHVTCRSACIPCTAAVVLLPLEAHLLHHRYLLAEIKPFHLPLSRRLMAQHMPPWPPPPLVRLMSAPWCCTCSRLPPTGLLSIPERPQCQLERTWVFRSSPTPTLHSLPGKYLVSASTSTCITFWRMPSGQCRLVPAQSLPMVPRTVLAYLHALATPTGPALTCLCGNFAATCRAGKVCLLKSMTAPWLLGSSVLWCCPCMRWAPHGGAPHLFYLPQRL
jgi:hypothetical protein